MNRAVLCFLLPFEGWLPCGVALGQSSPDVDKCAEASGSDEAMAVCSRAITSGHLSSISLPISLYNRGTAWNSKGDYDRAIADFNEAIGLRPEYARAYNNRGNAWNHKGDYGRAIADYSEAIRLDPQDARAYNNRGLVFHLTGDSNRAIADYSEAIRLNPKDAWAYLNRGATRFAQGRFEPANADFAEALRMNPTDASVVIWRYLAQSRAGRGAPAASEVVTNAAQVDKGKWPAPIIDLFAGLTNVAEVLEAAMNSEQKKQRDQICVAAFFVGEWYLLQGRRSEARTSLERAERDCPKHLPEFSSASAELKRLLH